MFKAAHRAGITNGGVHILRHTFCSHLAMRGAPARAIQELAGHADLTTTQRYMHLSPAAVEASIRLLEQPIPRAAFGELLERRPTGPPNPASTTPNNELEAREGGRCQARRAPTAWWPSSPSQRRRCPLLGPQAVEAAGIELC